jgi:hypothetical protein
VPSIKRQFAHKACAFPSAVSRIIWSLGSSVDASVRAAIRREQRCWVPRIPRLEIRINESAKNLSGVRRRVKIFELVKHFVRLRVVNEIWGSRRGIRFLI